jgi:hypothetical protein
MELFCRRLCGHGDGYFWWKNIQGMHESSEKALRIMQDHHGDGGDADRLVPGHADRTSGDAAASAAAYAPVDYDRTCIPMATPWAGCTCRCWRMLPWVLMLVGFGHSVLAMSGEESLAQVNREIEYPKLKNLEKAGAGHLSLQPVVHLAGLVLRGDDHSGQQASGLFCQPHWRTGHVHGRAL